MPTATRLTDREFHQEILDLVNGTHWTKGYLATHCWVPIPPDKKLPEDAEVLPMVFSLKTGKIVTSRPRKGLYEERLVYQKAQWCLVGMVLKVADLGMYEGQIETDAQVIRIIEQLYNQLPKEFRNGLGSDDYYEDIEWWNDRPGRTKQDIIDLVTRARDAAPA